MLRLNDFHLIAEFALDEGIQVRLDAIDESDFQRGISGPKLAAEEILFLSLQSIAATGFHEADEMRVNRRKSPARASARRVVELNERVIDGFVLAGGLETVLETPALDDFLMERIRYNRIIV